MPTNNTQYCKGSMEGYNPHAPVENITDNVYYVSRHPQQSQPTEYTYPHQTNLSYVPLPPPPHVTSVNDTTRFTSITLPYPNQSQDTRNLAQYDSRDWMQWSTRMSSSMPTEISPPIPQLIEDSHESPQRHRDSEYFPPMNSSHRHRMPQIPELQDELEDGSQTTSRSTTHRCLVGRDDFPKPRPNCEFKQKFTPDDDELLKLLKHDKKDPYRLGSKDDSLTWRQIADFFPGRAPGTLQVHYCKEVNAKKAPEWTEQLDNKLRAAMAEYEKERWQVIAKIVKGKNYAAACEERARLLQKLDLEGQKPQYSRRDQAEAQLQMHDRDREQEDMEEERAMLAKNRKTQGRKRKM